MRKLDEGQYDTIVLASAGLRRLGWQHRIVETLDPEVMCPAVGQGALGHRDACRWRTRIRDCRTSRIKPTRVAVTAERALLASLGGGCQVPIGAYAVVHNGSVKLRAVVISPDGTRIVRKSSEGEAADAERLGRDLGEQLLAAGGRAILEAVYGA